MPDTLELPAVIAAGALAGLLDGWAQAWEPTPTIDRAAWCAEHLRLPAESSATPGRYDLDRYPYVRGVLDAADDPAVEVIVLEWATQLGKTTLLQALLASTAALAPVPAMLAAADRDGMLELRDKFYAMAAATEPLRPTIPPTKERNNRWIDVGRLRCHLAFAYNTQRLSGKSCALVLCTELDRWRQRKGQGSPEKLAAERVKAFYQYKIVYESTPTDEESRIEKQYQLSDRRRYLVPCPRCNHFQELRFFPHLEGPAAGRGGVVGLKDGQGNWRPAEVVRQEAYYLCKKGCRIDSEQKPAMVADGQHVPAGQHLTAAGKLVGQPEQGPRIWGSRLNSLYAEPVTFGRMAAEYLECRDDLGALCSFYQNWLAKIWRKKTKLPKWHALGRRLRGVHRRGSVPPWAIFLTAGVDVGDGYCRWVVRAWGEGGTSALVDFGTTHQVQSADGSLGRTSHLDQLDVQVLARTFPLLAANPLGQQHLIVAQLGIDCGYKPHLVHDFARREQRRQRVRQVCGKSELEGGEPWRSQLVERSARTGKAYPGGQLRWWVNRALFNADLQERWAQPLDEPGAWLLCDSSPDELETYLRELVNEAPEKHKNKKGRETTTWVKVDGHVGNHYWDAEAYAAAIADMIVGGDWERLQERFGPQALAAGSGADREEGGPLAARDHESFSAR